MAASQTKKSQTKKTPAKKSAQTRKSSAKKTGSASKKAQPAASRTSSAKKTPSAGRRRGGTQPGAGRTVWAAMLLVLSVFSALSWFRVDGSFIALLEWLERGLVGCGYWVAPVALLIASGVLFFHRNRPVLGRTICALLLPLLIGAEVHTIFGTLDLDLAADGVSRLWDLQGGGYTGGVLGGSAAVALSQVFSRQGAFFLLLLATVAAVMVLTSVTPELLADAVMGYFSVRQEKRRKAKAARQAVEEQPHPGLLERLKPGNVYDPEEDEEEEEPEEAEEPEEKKPSRRPVSRRRFKDEFDLEVDEPASPAQEPPPPEVEMVIPEGEDFFPASQLPKKRGKQEEKLFNGKPSVSTPGDYLARVQQEEREELREQPSKKAKKKRPVPASAPAKESAARTQEEEGYHVPSVGLLNEAQQVNGSAAGKELEQTKALLEETIQSFGIESNIVEVTRGPSVTRYDLELERGIRLNKLTNLSKDIALSLGVVSVRIAPVPGQNSVVGIEVPNRLVNQVTIRSVIDSKEFREAKSPVTFAVGKDIANRNVVGDIAKLPHMLIAGTTGSGKSVCTNSLIVSLLYKSSPEDVNLIMIDPKMVELGNYNGIPHLRIPVVTDPKKAAGALQWAVYEMMQRYQLFAGQGVRDLNSYNAMVTAHPDLGAKKLPRIVIDELADLMLVAAKEVEESICRVAQMGRAAGMHLIIATQRPSTDVITGLMKANIPSRIALAVASSLESRIILDSSGAENLVGNGDMLFAPLGKGKRRVQGCFISEQEVNDVIADIKKHSAPNYDEAVIQQVEENAKQNEKKGKGGASAMNVTMPDAADQQPEQDEGRDPLFVDAVDTVVETEMASVSMLQRKLKLGYARAARLVDQMEEAGIVGPFEGSKPRKVLVNKERWSEMKLQMGQKSGLDANLELAKAMSAAADAEAFSDHEAI